MFLDRDGVLNRYLPDAYIRSSAELELVPGAGAAIAILNFANVPAIVISNQQGVGKGLMSRRDLDEVEQALRSMLSEAHGATLARTYYCTHLRQEHCECRKPKPGMILQAIRDYKLDVAQTAFIGDSESDIQAAHAAGVGTKILVLTGATTEYRRGQFAVEPDSIFLTIETAVHGLLEERD